MAEKSRSHDLLQRVAFRLRLASFARRLDVMFLFLCGLYAVLLLVSRFTGFGLDYFTPTSLLFVPAVALIVATLWHRRPSFTDAARAVDGFTNSKDLFLTTALIEKSAGEYQPLVTLAAEERAKSVMSSAVVPFRGLRQAAMAAGFALVLVIGAVWFPQFDPFGKVLASENVKKRHELLAESKKATELRTAQLKKDESEGELSEETKKSIENLKAALNKMKPSTKGLNSKELAGNQKNIGDQWRKLSGEKLKDLLAQNPQGQQFGAIDRDKLEKWTKELQEGSTKSLQKELDELKADLEKLAKTDDPVKKAELEQKVKKRMKDLSDFASDKVNSKPLAAALQRAMKQMELSKMEGMDSEGREAAEKSLELAKAELQEIAQSAKDLKALEEALKVIQMAKKLNEKEKLDGEGSEGAETMEDYAELYAQLMAQLGMDGEGDGEGMGDRGMGEGGKAPEDDSVETGFKTEQSKSAVTAGKVLLSVKTKGLSDKGDAQKDYKSLLQQVKQGVNEAILQEQVPPGYHERIKSYFDNLKETDGGEK